MRLKDIKYLVAYVIPLSGFVAVYNGGLLSYLTLGIAFVLIPIAEILLPQRRENISKTEEADRSAQKYFDWLLYLNLPLLISNISYLLYTTAMTNHATYEIVGMVLSIGVIGGASGINVAHELGHKQSILQRNIAKLLLLPVLYQHFYIEHNRGHHLKVATPEDPATSRYGEAIYTFWLRSIFYSFIDAWKIENKRVLKEGNSWVSWENEMIRFMVYQSSYLLLVFFLCNIYGLMIVLSTAFVAILLLETINYIEHYGIVRNKINDDRYERVGPNHSWNSDHMLGRIILYELTRHSDHHHKANKKYQVLKSVDEAPQLPFGYPTSMLMALVPPLWFLVMNRKVKELQQV